MRDIDRWWINEKDMWISYLTQSRKFGFSGALSYEDAEDLISEVYIYFLENPEMFDIRYVGNKINQKRIDLFRKNEREGEALAHYHASKGDGRDDDERELIDIIGYEISILPNQTHREVLTKHIIEGHILEGLAGLNRQAAGTIVSRFKKRMVTRYGLDI